MPEVTINYLAIIAAAASNMVIGFIWYGPLFGKTWLALVGKTEEEIRKSGNQAFSYGGAFISALVTAYVLTYIVQFAQADTLTEAVQVGFMVWLGFTVATKSMSVIFEGTRKKLYALNVGYDLVALVAQAIILVWWPW